VQWRRKGIASDQFARLTHSTLGVKGTRFQHVARLLRALSQHVAVSFEAEVREQARCFIAIEHVAPLSRR
jgi:hypothetical protein